MVMKIDNPIVPLTIDLAHGFERGGHIDIYGDVITGPNDGFRIEFGSHDGLPMIIDFRMGARGDKCIAMSHMQNGMHNFCRRVSVNFSYAGEQRFHNPLFSGQQFSVRIGNDRRHFSLFVNGQFVGHFDHFDRSSHIRRVSILGDVRLHQMMFERFRHIGQGTRVQAVPGSSIQPAFLPEPLPQAPPSYAMATGTQPIPAQPYPQQAYSPAAAVPFSQPPMMVMSYDDKHDRRRKRVRKMIVRHALLGGMMHH